MAFSQVLLSDVTANKETNQAILEMLDINEAHDLQYHVYEVAFGDKQIFCCLSGGVIENNEIQFTPVGLAAFEALTNIKEMPEAEYFADFIDTENNISEQIETVFARVPNGAKVCFVGDITGELKEELSKFFTMIH